MRKTNANIEPQTHLEKRSGAQHITGNFMQMAASASARTVVATDPSTKARYVYDGHLHESNAEKMVLSGYRMTLPIDHAFNINLASERSVEEGANEDAKQAGKAKAEEAEYEIPVAQIAQRVNYMPWKNIFYSCYFALTGVHGIHIFGGMIPIFILMVQAMRGQTPPRLHRIRRPLLALRRPGLDLPVPAALSGVNL